jgi:hypothetical protein
LLGGNRQLVLDIVWTLQLEQEYECLSLFVSMSPGITALMAAASQHARTLFLGSVDG